MKNVESAFQLIRMISVVVIVSSACLCAFVIFKAYQLAGSSRERIYVMVNGKALEAYASDRKDNIRVEAVDHVKMFHKYFFTLSPDDKAITETITSALYLADNSVKQQYDNLSEAGFYSGLISGNISQSVRMDSVHVDLNEAPYYFRFYGSQDITRTTSTVVRRLITEGYLRDVPRSDNNSHGLLIERWKIVDNSDISVKSRQP